MQWTFISVFYPARYSPRARKNVAKKKNSQSAQSSLGNPANIAPKAQIGVQQQQQVIQQQLDQLQQQQQHSGSIQLPVSAGFALAVPPPLSTPLRIPQVAIQAQQQQQQQMDQQQQPVMAGIVPMPNMLLAPIGQQLQQHQPQIVLQQQQQDGPATVIELDD